METFLFLLKVNLALVGFYGFYWLFLRGNTFFKSNRFYLLSAIIVSFLLPFIKIRHEVKTLPGLPLPMTLNDIPPHQLQTTSYQKIAVIGQSFSIVWGDIIWMIYGIGVLVFLIKFLIRIIKIIQLLRKSEPISLEEMDNGKRYWLLQTNLFISSFSFFNFLIINQKDKMGGQKIITEHEEVHMAEWHCLDVFLLEIIQIYCWFNPIIGLYKKSLRGIHEFIADEIASQDNPIAYAQFLFTYHFRTNISVLTNDFFAHSLLKQRIKMLAKVKSSNWVLGKYLFIVPFLACISYFVVAQKVATMKVYETFDTPAEFDGGRVSLENYVAKNLKYPEEAQKKQIRGEVYAAFEVAADGSLSNFEILRGLGYGCDEEVLRVLKKMPPFLPAQQTGKYVKTQCFMNLFFGNENGLQVIFYSRDQRFKGVLIIDNQVVDYGEALFPEEFDKYRLDESTGKADKSSSFKIIGKNDDLVKKYGERAANGLQFIMKKKFPLIFIDGKQVAKEAIKGGYGFTEGYNPEFANNFSIEILDEKEATEKYQNEGKDGAIIIFHNQLAADFGFPKKDSIKKQKFENKSFTFSHASYKGGTEALSKFIAENLQNPQKLTGTVYVRFTVTADGLVKNAHVIKGMGNSADEEAIKVVSKLTHWKPAQLNDEPFDNEMSMPIFFTK